MNRKRFLTSCILVVICLGLALAAYPFIASLAPGPKSGRIVEIDLSKFPLGDSKLIESRGKPVLFFMPSAEEASYLVSLNDETNGPDFTAGNVPKFFLYEFLSTHLGCMLKESTKFEHDIYGYIGYWDPCHRGFWDKAGRLIPGIAAGEGLANLTPVTDYEWVSDTVIRIEGSSI